jgi:hypothetical protein
MSRHRDHDANERDDERGETLGGGRIRGFLRTLLAGVPWSESADAEDALVFEAPRSGRLRIHNPNGRTRVRGEERSDIAVRASKRARAESSSAAEGLLRQMRISQRSEGGGLSLQVEAPRRWNRRGHVHLEVLVPRGLSVEVSAVNGRVEIEGIRGEVRARSSNGSARICDVIGDVEVATSNAKVFCACTCGKLRARSSNGRIVLEDHRGDIDAATSNGLITAQLAELGRAGVELCTSNGRIALTLPDDVDAEVDMAVDNGVIRNDRVLDGADTADSGHVQGRLGKGGALIKLRTSNGSISLR